MMMIVKINEKEISTDRIIIEIDSQNHKEFRINYDNLRDAIVINKSGDRNNIKIEPVVSNEVRIK